MSQYELAPKPNKSIITTGTSLGHVSVYPESLASGVYGLRFGFDHVLGIWFDVTQEDPSNPGHSLDEPVKEFSTQLNGVNKCHLLEAVRYYASEAENSALEEVLLKCAMDLPF